MIAALEVITRQLSYTPMNILKTFASPFRI